MSLLGTAAPVAEAPRSGGRRAVTLLSGFLGSGKTTLLRSEINRGGGKAPAVIVNDFAQTMVDSEMLATAERAPVVLSGGCICCERREELAAALRELVDAEQRGETPRREHIVIETSGLTDPGPVAFTLANDPVLKHHLTLHRICIAVDALNGLESIKHHDVALRQLLAADDILVTKADLATPEALDDLVVQLRVLNSSASVQVTANGELLRMEVEATTGGMRKSPVIADVSAHTRDVSTLEVVTDAAVDWQAFSIWLSLLLRQYGTQVLRVKGVLDVAESGPIAVHGVQHTVHRPEHIQVPIASGTRLVFIVQGIREDLLRKSFDTFLGIHQLGVIR